MFYSSFFKIKEFLGNRKRVSILPTFFAFFLGGICCSIRFTCLLAYVPMGIILSLQQKSRSVITFLIGYCLIPGFLGLGATVIIDRFFYGFWAIPVLGNIQFNIILGMSFCGCISASKELGMSRIFFSSLIVVHIMFKFIGNGSLYGTHPGHWYLSTGIPAVTGVLFPLLLVDLFSSWSFPKRNLWIICYCYVLGHSSSEHKEFRFLLPLLPLFCLLSGQRISQLGKKGSGKMILILAGAINLGAVLYLGLVHQSGYISINRKIVQLVKNEPQTYTIHYLMDCHSTPLMSHLHAPPLNRAHLTCELRHPLNAGKGSTCSFSVWT